MDTKRTKQPHNSLYADDNAAINSYLDMEEREYSMITGGNVLKEVAALFFLFDRTWKPYIVV